MLPDRFWIDPTISKLPKKGAAAGVGIGMLTGGGIPLNGNQNKIKMFKFSFNGNKNYLSIVEVLLFENGDISQLLKLLYLKLPNFHFRFLEALIPC